MGNAGRLTKPDLRRSRVTHVVLRGGQLLKGARTMVLPLERLRKSFVCHSVEAGWLTVHGWHCVIKGDEVHVLDAAQGVFCLCWSLHTVDRP